MAIILAQVIFGNDTGLPQDQVVNTFWFNGSATDVKGNGIRVALADFYNTNNGAGDSIDDFLSSALDTSVDGATVKCYDMTAGPGGTPFYEGVFTLGGGGIGSQPLPNEVALVLSFKATPLAGAVEARRRGRVYIGPLNAVVLDTVTGDSRPDTAFRTCLLDAAQRLHDGADANATPWVVYSRVNDTTALVDIAWVDNAFDTQRRRGLAATTRTTVTL